MYSQCLRKSYLKYLWYKQSCFFHWAHKPLCNRFRNNVIRIHRFYICRGCFMAYSGMMVSFLLLGLFHASLSNIIEALFILLCSTILPLSYPRLYKKLPRLCCDLLRFFTGTLPVLIVWLFYLEHDITAISGLLILCLFGFIYSYQRNKQKLKACEGCFELKNDEICSGFKLQAQAIREYENQATDFLNKSGYVPNLKKRD